MSKSQFPQVRSNNSLTDHEQAAMRRSRRGRAIAALGSMGAVIMMLGTAGCPEAADMDGNPGGSGTTGGSSSGSGGGGNCETACVTKIFSQDAAGCKLCHFAPPTPELGSLDLVSPGYTARLKDVPSKHTGIMTANPGCPTGDLLINTANPGESWLWKKLKNQQGMCGTKMPQTSDLNTTDMKCLEDYITCVAGKPITGGGGSGGAGGSATGGGGAGGASGGGGAGGASGGGGAGGGSAGGGAGGGGAGGASGGGGAGGTN